MVVVEEEEDESARRETRVNVMTMFKEKFRRLARYNNTSPLLLPATYNSRNSGVAVERNFPRARFQKRIESEQFARPVYISDRQVPGRTRRR